MVRGKKAQANAVLEENSTSDTPVEDPSANNMETKKDGRAIQPTAKGRGRGKAVTASSELINDDSADGTTGEAQRQKNNVGAVSDKTSASAEEPKSGRGRGKKITPTVNDKADTAPLVADFSEPPVAPKKGRGRQKKGAVVSTADLEDENADHEQNTGKEEVSDDTTPATKGKKVENKDAEPVSLEAESSEPSVAPKKGRGRQKKEVLAVADVEDDHNDHERIVGKESKSATSTPATKGRKVEQTTTSKKAPVEVSKKVGGKSKKDFQPETAAIAEEVLPEKKTRIGRPKKTAEEEKFPEVPSTEQAQEQDEETKSVSSPAVKKGRSKKVTEKKEQTDLQNVEEAGSVEEQQAAQDVKKKNAKGRKEGGTSASEVDIPDVPADFPVNHAPSVNIEVRKTRGVSRPTTPALPDASSKETINAAPEVKKGRGRVKKDAVVAPQGDHESSPKKVTRTNKMATSKDEADGQQTSDVPSAKKRAGRSKKTVAEKPESDVDEGEMPSPARNERKRKEKDTESQIARKTLKQK